MGRHRQFLSDLNAERVSRYLAERREHGLSIASSNHYLTAVKGFVRWLLRKGRATESPLIHLSELNDRVDKRRFRPPFEPNELRQLLATA